MTADKVPLDEQGFTNFMADRLRQAVPDYPVVIADPLTIEIASPGGPLTCNLGRAHDYVQGRPGDLVEWLDSYVEKVRAYLAGMNTSIDRTMLRVVVRNRDYLERMKVGAVEKGSDMVVEPLTDDLSAACYIDLPTALRSAMTADLAALGLTPAAAMAEAKANQAAGRQEFEQRLEDLGDDIGILAGDAYQSSWFALHDAWADLAERYEGGLLVAVPGMDTLLYARETGEDSIIAMHEAADDVAGRNEAPISKSVYRWAPDGWHRLPGPIRMGGKNVYFKPKF